MSEQYRQARLSRDPRFDGQFFIAVKTTGIFCRPVCPAAPPLENNVEYYALAHQAMQAGYRPCLRCRPDSAPESPAWRGVDTTVERGLRLLTDNPEQNIKKIADRLGITDRYFRALLQRHIGVSPKQYRLFEQLLFAKQLLHQGQLSVEQVAQASGFTSARRLQTHMKSITGLTPSQIRKRKRNVNGQHIRVTLPFRPPYAWPFIRDFLARRMVKQVEQVTDNSYARHVTFGEVRGWFRATFDDQRCYFDVEIELDDIRMLKPLLTKIRRILDLQCDPILIQSALLSAGVASQDILHGLRIPGVWDTFEAGCRAILGQQVSVKAAHQLLNTLVMHVGRRENDRRYFPTPQQVADAPLQELKMPDSRRQTLRHFAQHMAAHADAASPQDWLQLKGIGPWTVAYMQLRGESAPDIWLESDLVIKKQIDKHRVTAQRAAPWRSYLTLQLWSMA